MIDRILLANDLRKILNQSVSVDFTLTDGEVRKCHFNKTTKVIFDDGLTATKPSILLLEEDNKDINVKTIITINNIKYEVTQIELESNVLKRCFLREI